MGINRINSKTSFTGFYMNTERGFINLANKGKRVSTEAFVDSIIGSCQINPKNYKSLDLVIDDKKTSVFLDGEHANEYSQQNHILDKLEFFNKYLEAIGIKKHKIEPGQTKAFETYILG